MSFLETQVSQQDQPHAAGGLNIHVTHTTDLPFPLFVHSTKQTALVIGEFKHSKSLPET